MSGPYGLPRGGLPRGVRLWRSAAFTLAVTPTAIEWDRVVKDTGGLWLPHMPTRITFPSEGWWWVGGYAGCLTNQDSLVVFIRLNGVAAGPTGIGYSRDYEATNGVSRFSGVSVPYYFRRGDYVELMIDTGAANALSVGNDDGDMGGSSFGAVEVGAGF